MAGADGFFVPNLGGVGDALVRVKERRLQPSSQQRSPACTRWKLSWVTGAGLVIVQATAVSFCTISHHTVALANGPSALPAHSEGGASPGDVGRQMNAHRVRLASPSDTVISA